MAKEQLSDKQQQILEFIKRRIQVQKGDTLWKIAKKMNSNLTNYGKAVYNSTKASFSKNPTGR